MSRSTLHKHAARDWLSGLPTNAQGRKILTFGNAVQLASHGCPDAWFIAPYATCWAVGREADDGERYYLLRASGEPVVFGCRQDARRFLDALLEPSDGCLGELKTWAQRLADAFICASSAVHGRQEAIARRAARVA